MGGSVTIGLDPFLENKAKRFFQSVKTMRKRMAKKPKHYKPQRIVNPTSRLHTARLFPCQSIALHLSSPMVAGHSCVTSEAKFHVTLTGQFLIIEKVHVNKKGDTVYIISPKFDFTEWAEYSEVFLGEIVINIINNDHSEKQNCSFHEASVCVYQSMKDHEQERILTVINPEEANVRIEPYKMLEVVVYEPEWNNHKDEKKEADGYQDEWKLTLEDHEIEGEGIFLKALKDQIVYDKLSEVEKKNGKMPVVPRFKRMINPRLIEVSTKESVEREVKDLSSPCREHHMWYAFDENTAKKISSIRSGIHPLASLTLNGSCKANPSLSAKRTALVHLAIHGKKQQVMHSGIAGPADPKKKQEVVKRVYDKIKNLLSNPASTEQVDFHQGFDELVIEIVAPDVLWPTESDQSRWEIEMDDSWTGKDNLNVIYLSDYYRYGYRFQRFRIEIKSSRETTETKFLGAFKIHYPPKATHHEASKRISFWITALNQRRRAALPSTHVTRKAIGGTSHYSHYYSDYKVGKGYYNGVPEKMCVKIEELPTTTLEDHAHTRLVKNVYLAQEYRSDGEGTWCYKKKGTTSPITPRHSIMGNTTQTTMGGTGYSARTNTTEQTSQVVLQNEESEAIYNPQHLQHIVVDEGQNVVIRMSPPSILLGQDKCPGELWGLSTVQIADARPTIESNRVYTTGNSCFQEMKIKPDLANLPDKAGQYPAGAVKLECSEKVLIVCIDVNKSTLTDFKAPEKPTLPTNVRFIVPTKKPHEAENKKYRLVENWEHNDGLIVQSADHFFLKPPSTSADWLRDAWSWRVIQHPIPNEIWDALEPHVRKGFDQKRPWMTKRCPRQFTSSCAFYPIESQNDHMNHLLDLIAKASVLPYFPVATVIFENSHHAENKQVITAQGIFDINHKLRRMIHLYVDLQERQKKFAPPEFVLENPSSGAEVKVAPNTIFLVKLRSDTDAPWFCAHYPTFLHLETQSHKPEPSLFRFRVKEGAKEEGKAQFICAGVEKFITISCKD